MSSRSRPPGSSQPFSERVRVRSARLALGVATVAALAATVGALLFGALSGQDEAEGSALGPTADRPPTLPLDLEQLDLEQLDVEQHSPEPDSSEPFGAGAGLVEITPADEGPAAIGFCDTAPNTEGLIVWSGNRLTESGSRRRVAQMVVRFASSVDAARFMASTAATADCESWEAVSGTETMEFTVAERIATTIHGDETNLFDVQAGSGGPDLFLRIAMVRSGPEVAHITVVSPNQQDLDRIDELVTEASDQLGYS